MFRIFFCFILSPLFYTEKQKKTSFWIRVSQMASRKLIHLSNPTTSQVFENKRGRGSKKNVPGVILSSLPYIFLSFYLFFSLFFVRNISSFDYTMCNVPLPEVKTLLKICMPTLLGDTFLNFSKLIIV